MAREGEISIQAIRLARFLASVVAAAMAGGCVLSYVDDTGARRVIGLADVEVRPADGVATFAGDVISIRGLGLVFNSTVTSSNLTLGYVRETTALLRNCDVGAVKNCGDGAYSRLGDLEINRLAWPRMLEGGGNGFMGLVDLRLPAPSDDAPVGGHVVDLVVYGVGFARHGQDARVTFGYDEAVTAMVSPNSFVVGNPLHVVDTMIAARETR